MSLWKDINKASKDVKNVTPNDLAKPIKTIRKGSDFKKPKKVKKSFNTGWKL
jgi:hypothetical protein